MATTLLLRMKPPDLISSNEMKKPGRKTGLFCSATRIGLLQFR
jgi:hypothetical protein